jgi:hypothetical protein
MQSMPPEKNNLPIKIGLEWVKETLLKWISIHGPMIAMSHNEDKNRAYAALLSRLGIPFSTKKQFDDFMGGEKTNIVVGS